MLGEVIKRPVDERLQTLQELARRAKQAKERSRRLLLDLSSAQFVTEDETVALVSGKTGAKAQLTDHSFRQLCARINAPPSFVSSLSPYTATAVINELLPRLSEASMASILIRDTGNGRYRLSGINGPRYPIVYNADLLDMFHNLSSDWKLAHNNAAYYSDHNFFAFFVKGNVEVDDGSSGGLSKGFMLSNSECGAGAITLTSFMFRWACSNLQIFGLRDMEKIRIKHIGQDVSNRAFTRIAMELERFGESPICIDKQIKEAKKKEIAKDASRIAEILSTQKVVSQKVALKAYALAEEHEPNPRSYWSMLQGITRYSQTLPHGDRRIDMDISAGRLLSMAQ